MTELQTPASPRSAERATPAEYRRDIDGLRALAVLLVVVYHVWLGRVSGGVDVFLMISAYFVTVTFVRKIDRARPLGVGGFWVRRFVRLLPAAAVTLLAVLATVGLVYPSSQWGSLWSQTWASLFYMQNWELALSAVDYYDRGVPISPLQHFWSLSVQGQVFILWPIVLVGAALVIRRTTLTSAQVLTVVFGAIFVGSLAYSVVSTELDQRFAYFDTFARLWEFALGSLLAVWGGRLVLPGLAASLLGWVGLAALVLCGVLLDVRGGFPGYLALWPTLAAAAVVVAGAGSPRGGPSALLQSRPLQFLGRSAYALYLVHWPILITWMLVQGRAEVGPVSGTVIITISILLGVILSRGVENPLRHSAWVNARVRHGVVVLTASVALVAAPLTVWQCVEAQRIAGIESTFPGALVVFDPAYEDASADVPARPQGSELPTEWVTLAEKCSGRFAARDPLLAENCMQTPMRSSGQRTVLVVGDSHAQQWMGALTPLAAREGWQLVAVLRGGCNLGVDEPGIGDSRACDAWRAAALKYIEDLHPDALMTMGTAAGVESPGERVPRGLERTLADIAGTGIPVLTFRDNPRFEEDQFECVERNGEESPACARSAQHVLGALDPGRRLSTLAGVEHVDLTGYLCPDGLCAAVIGNVVVYRDDNHLSRRFAETLARPLEAVLRGTAWWAAVSR